MYAVRNMKLVVKPYRSDNPLGYNAIVQCLDESAKRDKIVGLLYVSFDHSTPRFLWEKAKKISPSLREYLELRAQEEAQKEIRALGVR